jgi:hypothetical protein
MENNSILIHDRTENFLRRIRLTNRAICEMAETVARDVAAHTQRSAARLSGFTYRPIVMTAIWSDHLGGFEVPDETRNPGFGQLWRSTASYVDHEAVAEGGSMWGPAHPSPDSGN